MVTRHMDLLLDEFGPDRLIWGSDWPVLTTVAPYSDWMDMTTGGYPDSRPRSRCASGANAERFIDCKIAPESPMQGTE